MIYLWLVVLLVTVIVVISRIVRAIQTWRWVNRCEREYLVNPDFRAYCDELDDRRSRRVSK